ncbi:TonB-dependent receptor domain-containing protein [Pantoea sp. B65]|uniref:TonB-dependent receptor domain-containing protein n=1 Tax=Pantoea sp. B65 TaxID=2813359 RepID=UPI0039B3A1E0
MSESISYKKKGLANLSLALRLGAVTSLIIGTYAVAASTSGSGIANDAEKKDDTLIVSASASGVDKSTDKAPASVTSVSHEEINKKPYRDIADLLTGTSGVTTTIGGDHKEINIRGMGSEYTLYLIDGMRIDSRDSSRLFDGYGQMNAWIPPASAIDHIEVIRGPMSSLYGSDAIGGVINIITRKNANNWQGTVGTNYTMQEHHASGDIFQNDFFVTGPLIDKVLSMQAYGNYSKRDEDDIYNGYRGSKRDNITGKIAFTPNDKQEVSFTANHTQQDITSTVDKSISPECTYYSGCPSDYRKKAEVNRFSINHIGYWDIGKTESYIQSEDYTIASQDIWLKNLNMRSSLSSNIGSHILTFGGELSFKKLHDGVSNQLSSLTDIERTEKSLFIEDSWMATEDFTLTSGVRFDNDNQFGNHWSPRVYGVWGLADNWTLKGGVSSGFKAPDITETSPNFGTVSYLGNVYGNAALKPEKSLTQEIGILYNNDEGLTAGLTLFNNQFKDKISTISCPESQCESVPNIYGGYPLTYQNIGKAVTRGVEATLAFPITDKIDITNNYTYTYSKQQSGENEGKPLTKLPKNQFNSTLNYQYSEKLKTWFTMNIRGKDSDNVGGTMATILPVEAPAYTMFDLGADYLVSKNIDIKTGVSNLLDKKIRYDDFGYTEDGRRYWVALNYSF